MAKIIGISGGVASGKTTVARMLAERGARVIDADVIAHEALRDAAIKEKVVSQWGDGVLDDGGEISRAKLGRIVFSDEAGLRRLEGIVHPTILARIRAEIAGHSEDEVILLDAALLNESGLSEVCDAVIFVEADRAARLSRAMGRGWSEGDCAARERRQMDLAEKRARADWVVDNSGPVERLGEQLAAIWRDIIKKKKQ